MYLSLTSEVRVVYLELEGLVKWIPGLIGVTF